MDEVEDSFCKKQKFVVTKSIEIMRVVSMAHVGGVRNHIIYSKVSITC